MKHYILEFIKKNRPLIVTLAAVSPWYLTAGCPIRFIFGICCPGCGMSRAVMAVLRLDFEAALHYHPLVFVLPIAVVVYFIRDKIPKKLMTILCTAAILILVTVFVIRLTGDSPIVYWDLSKGALYRLFHKLTN